MPEVNRVPSGIVTSLTKPAASHGVGLAVEVGLEAGVKVIPAWVGGGAAVGGTGVLVTAGAAVFFVTTDVIIASRVCAASVLEIPAAVGVGAVGMLQAEIRRMAQRAERKIFFFIF